MRDINLKATEYFEAVARLGTVTKAAEELEISPSAVSQQVSQLESQLGVKLFRREKQRLILTIEGDRLFETTTQAFRAIGTPATSLCESPRASGYAGSARGSPISRRNTPSGTSAWTRHRISRPSTRRQSILICATASAGGLASR